MDKQGKRFVATQVLAASAVCASFLALSPVQAFAGDGARVQVTASIAKRAALKVVAQPSAVVITQADITRGYVDVPVPSEFTVQSNSDSGYILEFAAQGDFMRQILVKGLGADVQLSPAGGQVVRQPASGAVGAPVAVAVGYRFMLSEATQQGSYPWPMRVSVAPL